MTRSMVASPARPLLPVELRTTDPGVGPCSEVRTVCNRLAFVAFALLFGAGTPQPAWAQTQDPVSSAVVRIAAAAAGSTGDEGPYIRAAIEAMAGVLADWDRQLRSLEARAAVLAPGPSVEAAQLRVDLGRQYMARGRTADALRELEAAASLDGRRADVHLYRALAYEAAERAADAAAAFRAAWDLDRSNPVTAYWMVQRGLAAASSRDQQQATETLAAVYRTPAAQRHPLPARPPFPTFGSTGSADSDAPLALPAAYADGYALLARGDYAGALAGFREAARADPLLADPAHTLPQLAEGSAALRRGRPALARDRFQAARAAMPGSSEAHRLLGVAHWANRDFGMSVDELTEAVRLRPADERARIMLALVLVETGAHSKAEAVLRQTLEALPRSTLARLWLGSVYESLNRHIEAAHSYEAAAPATLTGRSRLYAAIAQLHEGAANVAGVVDALSRSVGLNPNNAGAHNALARGFAGQDRLDEAFAEHVAALLVDPESPDAYMGIGQLHLNAGRYAEAALVLQRLVSLQPASVEARYALANALQRSGKTEAGARELAEFQRLQATQVEARRRTMGLGVIKEEAALRAAEGAFDRAIALWEQAIDREPGVASNHAALAAALSGAGRLDLAAQQYERAAALGGSADVYRQLAAIYGKLGRSDDSARAHARYERALLVPSSDKDRR